jgi:hypothetical protein
MSVEETQLVPAKSPPGPMISKSGELPGHEISRDEAALILGFRVQGLTYLEISAKTGLTISEIRSACRFGRQQGALRDTIEFLDNECVPQAVENVVDALRDPTNANHWRATEKVLDGRGAFQKFGSQKSGAAAGGHELPPLQINIIAPGGGEVPTVIINSDQGSVVGAGHKDGA